MQHLELVKPDVLLLCPDFAQAIFSGERGAFQARKVGTSGVSPFKVGSLLSSFYIINLLT